MLKIREEYARDTSQAKLTDFFAKLLTASPLYISVGTCQRALMDESGMIRTQMRTHKRSENDRSAWDALYDTTP
jgi:hypothetical protein